MSLYRFGKHPPKHDYRTLRFRSYATANLAAPPSSYDVLGKVYENLKISDPTKLFPMDANDRYGDCTIAALAHAITAFRGMIGTQRIMSTQAVTKLYFKLTGGVDSGLHELDVLNYWRQHAVDGDKILAFVSIDPKNHTHIKQAIQLFGGVYLGFQCQETCQDDFHARKTWEAGRLTNDGHAVYAVGYDANTVTVLTWGNTQKGSWGWWDECVDEAYAILAPESKDSKFAPGFNFDALKSDLQAVADA